VTVLSSKRTSQIGFSNQAGVPDRYAARVIPWIIMALVAVPLVVVGFVATRRKTLAGEHPASEDAEATALTEQEFAEAEAYDAKWREEDKERYHQERFP
jgi:cytochrome c oxidase assembly factor CtaG